MFNLNYFKYLLNRNKHTFIYLGIIYTALYIYPMFKTTIGLISENNLEPYFIELCVLAIGFTFILPFVNFHHKFNKRAIDLYDALPLTKTEQLTTLLVFQILEVLVPFYICVVLGLIINGGTAFISYGCLITLIAVISLNCINTAIIFKTNSIYDGIVILGAYHLLPFVLYGSISLVFESIAHIRNSISELTNLLKLSPIYNYGYIMVDYYGDKTIDYSLIAIILAFMAVCLFSLVKDFKNRKPEAVEGISNNILAYPLLTYTYLFLVSLILSATKNELGTEIAIPLYLLLISAFITADFIYNRKIKINLRKIVAAIIVIFISLGIIKFVEINKSFGYNKIYPNDYEYVTVTYWTDVIVKDNETGKEYSCNINLYTDDVAKGDSFIASVQNTQDILHDEYYENNDEVYSMFTVNYVNKVYNDTYDYDYYSYVENYHYKTQSDTLINFFKNNKNKIHGTFEVYLDGAYEDGKVVYDADYGKQFDIFEDYEEFIKSYTIVRFTN